KKMITGWNRKNSIFVYSLISSIIDNVKFHKFFKYESDEYIPIIKFIQELDSNSCYPYTPYICDDDISMLDACNMAGIKIKINKRHSPCEKILEYVLEEKIEHNFDAANLFCPYHNINILRREIDILFKIIGEEKVIENILGYSYASLVNASYSI